MAHPSLEELCPISGLLLFLHSPALSALVLVLMGRSFPWPCTRGSPTMGTDLCQTRQQEMLMGSRGILGSFRGFHGSPCPGSVLAAAALPSWGQQVGDQQGPALLPPVLCLSDLPARSEGLERLAQPLCAGRGVPRSGKDCRRAAPSRMVPSQPEGLPCVTKAGCCPWSSVASPCSPLVAFGDNDATASR